MMGPRRRKTSRNTDAHAMAFLNRAHEYHEAANQLFDLHADGSLNHPINFLYFHTVELALKAFLRSRDIPIQGTKRASHNLMELYEECRNLGLKIGPSDRFDIGNIVSLLADGNVEQGFRYVSLKAGLGADLSWTRDVIEQLMRVVKLHVEAYNKQNPIPLGPAALKMRWGKPF